MPCFHPSRLITELPACPNKPLVDGSLIDELPGMPISMGLRSPLRLEDILKKFQPSIFEIIASEQVVEKVLKMIDFLLSFADNAQKARESNEIQEKRCCNCEMS